jgi:uncharacterized membrane protein YhaH (DUF805 family)
MRLARGPFWRLLAINILVAAGVVALLPKGLSMPWPGLEGTPVPPIPLKPIIAYLICIPAGWLGARRLHDVGRAGWHAWLPLMAFACATFMPSLLQPLLLKLVVEAQANPLQAREIAPKVMVGLWLIVLFVTAGSLRTVFLWLEPGETRENRYGPAPAGAAAAAPPEQRPPAFVLGGRMRRPLFWILMAANAVLAHGMIHGLRYELDHWAKGVHLLAAIEAWIQFLEPEFVPAVTKAIPLISVLLYLPSFAAAVLRLHDRNQSGILSFLALALSIAAAFAEPMLTTSQVNLMNAGVDIVTIYLLFQCLQPGDTDENRYGRPSSQEPIAPAPTPAREIDPQARQTAIVKSIPSRPVARQGFGRRGL